VFISLTNTGVNFMKITGLLYGAPLLRHVDFPVTEVLGPGATVDDIKALIHCLRVASAREANAA
jgi:hypothetical protein